MLVEAVPDAVLVTDQEDRIVVANRQTETLFGYARDELIGQQIEMLVPKDALHRHAEHRARYYARPHAQVMGSDLNLSAKRRDGTVFPVEISLNVIEGDDGFLVTSAPRDVSERQRLAAHVAQTQKMESLGRMAGGGAHNLNNLMTAIIGNTDLALMSLAQAPSTSATLADDMRAVRKSA